MKKYFPILVLLTIVFLITSCYKPPVPEKPKEYKPYFSISVVSPLDGEMITKGNNVYVQLHIDTNIQTPNYEIEAVIRDSNNTPVATLTAGNPYLGYVSGLDSGTYTISVLATETQTEATATAHSQFSITSMYFTQTEYPNFSWSGGTPPYKIFLNGWQIAEISDTNFSFDSLPEGEHQITVEDSTKERIHYNFEVDEVEDNKPGPAAIIYPSYRTLKDIGSNYWYSEPEGRYTFMRFKDPYKGLGAYGLPEIVRVRVRIYRYDTEGVRYRLSLYDSDGDGVPDSLKELSPNSWNDHEWYEIPYYDEENGGTFAGVVLGDDKIDAIYENEDGNYYIGMSLTGSFFKLGENYAIDFQSFDSTGAEGWSFIIFKLEERYTNDEKPRIYLDTTSDSVSPGGVFTLSLKAPNVREYVNEKFHNIDKPSPFNVYDISFNDKLLYIQIPVYVGKGLEIQEVSFPKFTDLEEHSHYKYDPDKGILTIYRGFVKGEEKSGSIEDTLAEIVIKVPEDYSESSLNPQIIYEGWFGNYSEYEDIPNSIIRDVYNRTIDGIVIDYEPLNIGIISSEE